MVSLALPTNVEPLHWRSFVIGALAGVGLTTIAVRLYAGRGEAARLSSSLQDIASSLRSLNTVIAQQQSAAVVSGGARVAAVKQRLRRYENTYSSDEDEEDDFQEAMDRLIVRETDTDVLVIEEEQRVQVQARQAAASTEPEDVQLFKKIDKIYDAGDVEQALDLVLKHQAELEVSSEGLWRVARSMYDKAVKTKGSELAILKQAQPTAQRSLDMNPNCAQAHKWFAVITGAMTDYVGLNEKLECGHVFKKHVEEAIRLDPNDGLSYHLLGRWCFEVAGLSWLEKRACAALIGQPPEATYDEALGHLLKADQLSPEWALNTLFVAKCYLKLGKKSEAQQWLRKCVECSGKAKEDLEAIEEARKLL
eukprot:m.33829 g.33829  ORF g.33829 m.33829 type:complete len:365 (+) comp10936_c0_seq1:35-1129(+)